MDEMDFYIFLIEELGIDEQRYMTLTQDLKNLEKRMLVKKKALAQIKDEVRNKEVTGDAGFQ